MQHLLARDPNTPRANPTHREEDSRISTRVNTITQFTPHTPYNISLIDIPNISDSYSPSSQSSISRRTDQTSTPSVHQTHRSLLTWDKEVGEDEEGDQTEEVKGWEGVIPIT